MILHLEFKKVKNFKIMHGMILATPKWQLNMKDWQVVVGHAGPMIINYSWKKEQAITKIWENSLKTGQPID